MDGNKFYYFQYHSDSLLPIYIRFERSNFESALNHFLISNKFKEIEVKEDDKFIKNLENEPNARLLTLQEASIGVARQIEQTLETDKFGRESITPRDGYKLYRYKNAGVMIFSFSAKEWTLGAFSDFGVSKDISYKIIVNRFLSWALVPHGIIGFWGVPVDNGLVVMKPVKANGEVVFIDVRKRKIYSQDGASRMKPLFTIMRLDPNLHGKNLKMNFEELLGFLSVHCSYFDYSGLSIPVRQLVQTVAKGSEGLWHPEESFKPRTDLSL